MAKRIIDPIDRFWSKVDKSEGCWKWVGTINNGGYGVFQLEYRKTVKAHRLAYELMVGPIPAGLYIDHICRNRLCVNPDHLRTVTPKQNTENQSNIGRGKSGVRGVHSNKRGWEAVVSHHGKLVYAGCFKTIAEAEAAAVAKRLELHTHNEEDRRAS